MEVIVGKNAGFCYGVQNVVDGVYQALEKYGDLYCLGEIVHNRNVIQELEERGLHTIQKIDQVKDRVMIRAHGIPKHVYEQAKRLNIDLIDLTCPNVLKIHKLIEEYYSNNYYIILIGVHNHPESIGSVSFGNEHSTIVSSQAEIEQAISDFYNSKLDKVVILAQTTYSLEAFNSISNEIRERLETHHIKVEIINTICNATKIRQEETRSLSKQVDCMIIIGGKNSSNTKKLYEIACENCKSVLLIENQDELDLNNLKNHNKIGIMAGASTPKQSIELVINSIKDAVTG